MAFDNTNSGALFKNDRKETENQPDYTGKINIEGKEYYLSAWVNKIQSGEKAGKKYFGIKVKPVEEEQSHRPSNSSQTQAYAASQKLQENDFDDDIPF